MARKSKNLKETYGCQFETSELVQMVRKYAIDNYDRDGWDFLVETLEDEEIAAALGNSKTLSGAVWACQTRLGLREMDAHRTEIKSA